MTKTDQPVTLETIFEALQKLTNMVHGHEGRFDKLEDGFEKLELKVDRGFTRLELRMDGFEGRLIHIEKTVDVIQRKIDVATVRLDDHTLRIAQLEQNSRPT